MQEVEFHQAYSSDLKRALQTCQNILAHNKKSIITSNHIVQDERLREQNFGVYENSPISEWMEIANKAKGAEKEIRFSNLPISQKHYSKKLS